MSGRVSSREEVLARIRRAIGAGAPNVEAGYAAVPRAYIRAGRLGTEEKLSLMVERLREYDAEVVETDPNSIVTAIAAQLEASGRRSFVVPPGLPEEWLVPGFDWKTDRGLTTDEIEQVEGVVTASSCGIADSGTIVLHHSSPEGRRVISLLPDWHLCVLRSTDVVETLPEYFARCETISEDQTHEDTPESMEIPALATYISGPSATADIEMTRIKGVHGPRFLHVVLVRDSDSGAFALEKC